MNNRVSIQPKYLFLICALCVGGFSQAEQLLTTRDAEHISRTDGSVWKSELSFYVLDGDWCHKNTVVKVVRQKPNGRWDAFSMDGLGAAGRLAAFDRPFLEVKKEVKKHCKKKEGVKVKEVYFSQFREDKLGDLERLVTIDTPLSPHVTKADRIVTPIGFKIRFEDVPAEEFYSNKLNIPRQPISKLDRVLAESACVAINNWLIEFEFDDRRLKRPTNLAEQYYYYRVYADDKFKQYFSTSFLSLSDVQKMNFSKIMSHCQGMARVRNRGAGLPAAEEGFQAFDLSSDYENKVAVASRRTEALVNIKKLQNIKVSEIGFIHLVRIYESKGGRYLYDHESDDLDKAFNAYSKKNSGALFAQEIKTISLQTASREKLYSLERLLGVVARARTAFGFEPSSRDLESLDKQIGETYISVADQAVSSYERLPTTLTNLLNSKAVYVELNRFFQRYDRYQDPSVLLARLDKKRELLILSLTDALGAKYASSKSVSSIRQVKGDYLFVREWEEFVPARIKEEFTVREGELIKQEAIEAAIRAERERVRGLAEEEVAGTDSQILSEDWFAEQGLGLLAGLGNKLVSYLEHDTQGNPGFLGFYLGENAETIYKSSQLFLGQKHCVLPVAVQRIRNGVPFYSKTCENDIDGKKVGEYVVIYGTYADTLVFNAQDRLVGVITTQDRDSTLVGNLINAKPGGFFDGEHKILSFSKGDNWGDLYWVMENRGYRKFIYTDYVTRRQTSSFSGTYNRWSNTVSGSTTVTQYVRFWGCAATSDVWNTIFSGRNLKCMQ